MKSVALFFVAVLALVLCLPPAASGQTTAGAAPKPEPSFQPIEDVPGLPRVLLIGDSISMGYTLPLREMLAGKVNVHRIPANSFTTKHTLAQLDEWLGTGKWDLVHFNCGLHDIVVMPNGRQQVSLADYEANLRAIIARLQKLGAKLIWCSTTPVPGVDLQPRRRNEDVVAYNAVARRVMTQNGVPINDLYAVVQPRVDDIRKPLNVHYFMQGNILMAQHVARCIQQALASGESQARVADEE